MARTVSSRGGADGGGGARRATVALLAVLALVLAGLAVVRFDLVDRFRGTAAPSDPITVAPPPGIEVPSVTAPPAVARVSPSTTLNPRAVRRALVPYLGDAELGGRVLASVAALDAGAPVFERGSGAAIPASTTKIVTGTAALLALGPGHRFPTSVVRAGPRRIVLVGGGDPLLERGPRDPAGEEWPYPERADLEALAAATAAALRADGAPARVRLAFDGSLFTGPAINPTWKPTYVPEGSVSPTSALWVDTGRVLDGFGRSLDPAADAAAAFATALAAQGVTVAGTPRPVSGTQGPVLAEVDSAPLDAIVERMLESSDNDVAEVLLRHVGLATEGVGSTAAGRRGVQELLGAEGVELGSNRFLDGSGLSRSNATSPELLAAVLRLAGSAGHPELRSVVTGLPVAGFTGSLTQRMVAGPSAGLGRVRAKTGTLDGVFSLAGVATGVDGSVMVFALMADQVPPQDAFVAQQTLDSAAAALGACACGA